MKTYIKGIRRPRGEEVEIQHDTDAVPRQVFVELKAPKTLISVTDLPMGSYIIGSLFGNKVAWDQGATVKVKFSSDPERFYDSDIDDLETYGSYGDVANGEVTLGLYDGDDNPYEGEAPTTGRSFVKLVVILPPS